MKCVKCGNEIKNDEKFCDECGESVEEVKEVKTNKNDITEKKDKSTLLCIISIILMISFLPSYLIFDSLTKYSVIFTFLARLVFSFPLLSFALAVFTKIKYKNSKFASILIIIYIVLFAIALILIIIVMMACLKLSVSFLEACGNCQPIGTIVNLLFK